MELLLQTQRCPGKGANVIALYGDSGPKICLSAHMDTKAETVGALDNASGVAALLALASELPGRKFPFCVEFAIFNGEDYYSIPGEMTYLNAQLSHPEDYLCAVNIDGAGLRDSNIVYSFFGCPKKVTDCVHRIAGGHHGFEEAEPWPQGDHTLFACSGIPAVAVTSGGIFELGESILHTENDTPALVDTTDYSKVDWIGLVEKLHQLTEELIHD